MPFDGPFAPERVSPPETVPELDLDALKEREALARMRAEEAEEEQRAEAAKDEPSIVETATEAAPVDPRVVEIERIMNADLRLDECFDPNDAKEQAAKAALIEAGKHLAHALASSKRLSDPLEVQRQLEEWLQATPSANRYYFRQLAHIKAGEIAALASSE